MSNLTGTMADWIAIWRSEMTAQDLTCRVLDDLAELGEGYMAKILCGARTPTAPTIAKINRALGLGIKFVRLAEEHTA